MKKILLAFFILVSFMASGQVLQKPTAYGYQFRRLVVDTLQAVPTDTFTVPTALRNYPFIARKGMAFYFWNTTTYVWSEFTGAGSSYTAGDGLLLTGTEFKVLTKRSITIDNDSLMLVNDSTASPVSYFYGTNVAGRKGWYAQSGLRPYTFTNGLTESGGTVKLGGTLVDGTTTIDADGNSITISDIDQFYATSTNEIVLSTVVGGKTSNISSQGFSASIEGLSSGVLSAISVVDTMIAVGAHLGNFRIDTLNYTLSTTGKKIMLRDTATGLVQNIDPALLTGATPTLQQVLTAGSTLTGGNDINTNGNSLIIGSDDATIDYENQNIQISVNDGGGISTIIEQYPDSLLIQPHLGQLNIDTLRTWTAVGDTTYKKPMTWDTRNGRWEYASNWFGGGGATPTLQQVLTAGSTLTGDNTIDVDGNDLTISDISTGLISGTGANDIIIQYTNGSTGLVTNSYVSNVSAGMTANLAGVAASIFEVFKDSIVIKPHLGVLNIDSLRSWTAIADSAYKRIMTWDERNGRWEYFDGYFPTAGSGGGTPAGNYGNVQLNRNGAFATPASDSVDYENSTGLTVKNNVNVEGTGKYFYGRWRARVDSTTSSGTPTINTDNVDVYKLTAQAADITSFTTNLSGTPQDGDILELVITGTAARAITWGASFVSTTVTLPATTVTTATLTVILQYYKSSSYGNNKWHCVNYY